jgi:branched-chain amino acid transport system ATP-binding protein
MTLLEVRGLRVSYGRLEVLHGVDVNVDEGKIVCVLGANAAGKTTLIKAILGLSPVSGGTITFRGERIDGMRPNQIIRRGFAVVPENAQVFEELSVLENLKMGLYVKLQEVDFAACADKMFALYPVLGERRNQNAGLLSGGERQMLAVARALISDPAVLIMDSPSMGLAPRFVKQQFETIRQLNADSGVTVMVVEQNANMALALSHSGYVLQNGEIALAGPSQDLLNDDHLRRAYLA